MRVASFQSERVIFLTKGVVVSLIAITKKRIKRVKDYVNNKKKSKKRRGKLHTTTESISLSETSNASDQNMYGFSSTSSELINTKSISNFSIRLGVMF